jgi:hypothetical protein
VFPCHRKPVAGQALVKNGVLHILSGRSTVCVGRDTPNNGFILEVEEKVTSDECHDASHPVATAIRASPF